jgi:hypothetical protein
MANYTVALAGANISPLILPERSTGGGAFTARYQIPYTVFQAAGSSASADTITVTLGTTPTTWIATSLLVDIPVAFAGSAAASSFGCTIGTTTTATAFASSFSILTAGVYQPPNGPGTVATPASSTGVASVTFQAVLTCTCGFASSFTTGFMTILLGLYDPTATA